MEQRDGAIIFNQSERNFGLPESISSDQVLSALDQLQAQEAALRREIISLSDNAHNAQKGRLIVEQDNFLKLGRVTRQLAEIAAPQLIERFLKNSSS